MTQDANEATRVMGAAGGPAIDRTMVAGAPSFGGPTGGAAGATQMGSTAICPVCKTNNSGLETFCAECGFLLNSTPGQAAEEAVPDDGPAYELVENSTGRRFRLKLGINTIGRENCDILLLESTVSRRHAQITVDNGLVIVMDLGSSNGTQIDGSRIGPNQPMPLANNSTVRFGNAVLSVVAPTGAAEATVMAGAPAASVATVQVSAPPIEPTLMAPVPPIPPAPASGEPAAASIPAYPIQPLLPDEPEVSDAAAPPAPIPISTPPPMAGGSRSAIAILKPAAAGGDPIFVGEGTVTVGRRSGNDVIITGDPYISGRHCDFVCDSSGCYLVDVGSTNGTLVNGARLEPNQKQLLLDGDSVSIGQTEYTFETLEAPDDESALAEHPAEDHSHPTHVNPDTDSEAADAHAGGTGQP